MTGFLAGRTEARWPKPAKRQKAKPKSIRRRTDLRAKRRAAKAAGHVDPDSWQYVLAFYYYGCAFCDADHWDQQDHVVPISRGGKHDISNLAPSCATCNSLKGTRTIWPARRHPFMEGA